MHWPHGNGRTFDDHKAAQKDEHNEDEPGNGVSHHKGPADGTHGSEQADSKVVHQEQAAHHGEEPASHHHHPVSGLGQYKDIRHHP